MSVRPLHILIWLLPALLLFTISDETRAQTLAEHEDLKRQADAAYRSLDYQTAIELMDQVLDVVSTDDVALYLRGSARVELGVQEGDAALIRSGIADARSAIANTKRADIDYYLPYLYGMANLAAIEERDAHLSTAIDVAGQLLGMSRWSSADLANIYYQRAQMRMQQEDYAAADEDFREAIRGDRNHLAAHLEHCALLARTADPAEAGAAFDRAAGVFPDNPVVFNNRGMFYQSLGQIDDALADFERAFRIDGEFADAQMNRGFVLLEADRLDEAIEAFDAALQISEDQPMVWGLRGTAKLKRGDLSGGVADYRQSLQLQPDNPATHADLGFALFFGGQFEEAIDEFQGAQQLDPQAQFLDGWLTAAWLASNQRLTAETQFAGSLDKPSTERTWFDMIVLFQLGKISENTLLDAVVTEDERLRAAQQCEAFYFIGLAKRRAGDDDEAERYFRQSVQTGASHFSSYRGAQFELKDFGRGPSA